MPRGTHTPHLTGEKIYIFYRKLMNQPNKDTPHLLVKKT